MSEQKLAYHHVLLATDLTEHTEHLAKRANAIAKATGAKLSIAHVLSHSPMSYGGEFSLPIDAELEIILEKQAKNRLAALGDKFNIPTNLQFLKQGSIKQAIAELAKANKVDLIVVGSHSHHGLDALIGSQANAILHAAPCDVWVVHL